VFSFALDNRRTRRLAAGILFCNVRAALHRRLSETDGARRSSGVLRHARSNARITALHGGGGLRLTGFGSPHGVFRWSASLVDCGAFRNGTRVVRSRCFRGVSGEISDRHSGPQLTIVAFDSLRLVWMPAQCWFDHGRPFLERGPSTTRKQMQRGCPLLWLRGNGRIIEPRPEAQRARHGRSDLDPS
jgi:hypothetical protein